MPDPAVLEGLGEIPDPAAAVARAPVPPARLPAERSATRAERRVSTGVAAALVAAWVVGGLAVFGLRPDVATAGVIAPIAAWIVGGAVVLGVVLRPRARGLPAGVRAVQHAVWIVPVAYVAGICAVAVPEPDPFTWSSLRGCLGISSLLTLGPLCAATVLLRRTFLSAPGWRGAAVGGLCGFLGAAGVHAHCPCQSLGHQLAAHGIAIALGAVAGAGLGRLGGKS
jgi:hypothetical protein